MLVGVGVFEAVGVTDGVRVGTVGVAVRRYWVALGDGVTRVTVLPGTCVAVQVGGMARSSIAGELTGSFKASAAVGIKVGAGARLPQATNPINNPIMNNRLNLSPLSLHTGGL